MMHRLLWKPELYQTLLAIDEAEARERHGKACPHCGAGVLHKASYPRAPRGGPPALPEAYSFRHSFSCSADRLRVTPPSVRFLGRRWYLGPFVVVLSALMHGPDRRRVQAVGISRDPTLPYSPYQNAKQESFWSVVEGRLLAMLEGVDDLTLEGLNEATQAWVEMDYNREMHSELGMEPLERFLEGPSVLREAPAPEVLRESFRRTVKRRQRTSDGTFTPHSAVVHAVSGEFRSSASPFVSGCCVIRTR